MPELDITGTLLYLTVPDDCIVIGVLLVNCPLELRKQIELTLTDGNMVQAIVNFDNDTLVSIHKQEEGKQDV